METRKITKIELDVEKNEINRFIYKEFTVNSAGDVLDETEFKLDSGVANKRIYRYFDSGDVEDYIEYDPLDKLLERHTYVRNESGDIDKVIYEYGDGHKTVKEFQYTDLGFADRATLKDENNLVTGYETYILDEEGQIVEQIETDADHNEISKLIKAYDENGLTLHEQQFIDGKLAEDIDYIYDEKDNLIKKITTNKTDRFEVIDEYTYDNHGNMLYNSTFQNGVLVFENRCTYDEDNNLLTEEFFEINYWERRITRHERLMHE